MRDIKLCHPRLQKLAAELVEKCSEQGLKIKIGETYRTVAEQDALYAQGRTEPGNIVTNAPGKSYSSYHQWGTAFDIFRNDGSGAYNESGKFFERVGQIGKAIGLEWGGDWKSIVDKPHFQLPDWGSSTSGIKKVYSNPEAFMKTWKAEAKSGWQQEDGGWRYYLNNGEPVRNAWYYSSGDWYWFDGAGMMVHETWYMYNGSWYYMGADGAMVKGQQTIDGKWYIMDADGAMATRPIILTPDQDGALRWPGLAE